MLNLLIGPIADLAGGFLKNKAEQSKAKHEAKMNVIQNDSDWEAKMADASGNLEGRVLDYCIGSAHLHGWVCHSGK